jgi:DNA polymerase-3 subunit delta'
MAWKTVGFEKIKKFFEKSLREGSLNHAYIFSGQEMIGKKTFALELAGLEGDSASINPNLLFIDTSSSESGQSIAIDEIRKIKDFLSLSSHSGGYKFVVIDDSDLMTDAAQNSLLKVLEEPSPSSVLILITSNPDSLLPTITSRCQEIRFPVHSKKLVEEFINQYIRPTSLSISSPPLLKKQTDFLTEFSNGRVGLIKNVIDEESFEEIEDSVNQLMKLIKLDLNERLTIAQKLTDDKSKANLSKLVFYWILYMRMRINEPKAHKILKNLLSLYNIATQPQFNQRLALENFMVQL